MHADRQVWLTRQNLAHQIIHCNTLTLQYNRLMLEKAQDELRAADRFVGQVRTTIRRSGITMAFEYAMREDHSSVAISGEVHLSRFPFVWFKFIARLASIIVTWCNVRLVLLLCCLMFYSVMHLLYCEISAPYSSGVWWVAYFTLILNFLASLVVPFDHFIHQSNEPKSISIADIQTIKQIRC